MMTAKGYRPPPHERFSYLEGLVFTAVDTCGGFKVFPPDELLDGTMVVDTEDIIGTFVPTDWSVEFSNGDLYAVTFTELLLLMYNFRQVKRQMEEADERGEEDDLKIRLITTSDPKDVLTIEVIEEMLGGLTRVLRE